jgi:hypothetical protein
MIDEAGKIVFRIRVGASILVISHQDSIPGLIKNHYFRLIFDILVESDPRHFQTNIVQIATSQIMHPWMDLYIARME